MNELKWGRLMVFAAILAVAGLLVYGYEHSLKEKRAESELNAKRILNLKENGVSMLRIGDGKTFFSFKCLDLEQKLCKSGDNSKWELTEPVKIKADDANVNALLTTLTNLQPTDSIDLTPETPDKRARLLKEYLLDDASRSQKTSRRVDVTFGDGATKSLVLGDLHPVGESFFGGISAAGKFDESKVLFVPSYFKSNFERDLTHWRDKRLFSLATHQVVSFTLATQKSKISGTKKDGTWNLSSVVKEKAETVPGDLEAIDNLLSAAGFLTAKSFVSENKASAPARARLKGSPQALSLSLTKEGGDTLTLLLYQNGSKPKAPLYATLSTSDPLYELDPAARDRLAKNLNELRWAKLLTSTDRFNTRKIRISGKAIGPAPLAFIQKDGKWANTDGKTALAPEKVNTLLDRMTGNRIREFFRASAIPGGEEGGVRVELMNEQDEGLRSYVFWKVKAGPKAKNAKDGTTLYARDLKAAGAIHEALLLDPSLLDAIPFAANHFEPTTPAPIPSEKK